jgi:RimJ/RimL family protein N-acetyltransferase
MDDLDAAHQLLDADLEWSGPGFTRDRREERLRFYVALAEWDDTRRLFGYRAITLKPTDELVGICGFIPGWWDAEDRALFDPGEHPAAALELEVGYALGSAHRGQGYATEALQALIDHAFGALGVGRLVAGTGRENVGSIALLRRVGMRTFPNPRPGWPEVIGVLEKPRS